MLQACKNPIHLKDSDILVPCGQCAACRHAKTQHILDRLDLESKSSKVVLFFTLTYDNANIPRMKFDYIDDIKQWVGTSMNREQSDSLDYKDDLTKIITEQKDLYIPKIQNSNLKNTLGYVNKKDVQKFIKRLRRKVDYDKDSLIPQGENKQLRYFVVSEYGCRTYRPHYHGLLFLQSNFVADAIEKLYFHESWKLCRKSNAQIERVANSASSYCAKYINCNSDLPPVLRIKQKTATFYLSSRNPAIGCKYFNYNELCIKVEQRTLQYSKSYVTPTGVKSTEKKFNKTILQYFFESPFRNQLYTPSMLLQFYRAFRSEITPNQIRRIRKTKDRAEAYRELLKILPNTTQKIQNQLDNLNLFSFDRENYTISDIYDKMSQFDIYFGISQNRRVGAKFLVTYIKDNISLIDYLERYYAYHNLKFDLSMKSLYDEYNYLKTTNLSDYNILRYVYPSFARTIPKDFESFLAQDETTQYNFITILESFNLSLNDIYNLDNNKSLKNNDLKNILREISERDDYIAYTNYITELDILFNKTRLQNHLTNQNNSNYEAF